ncbi:MAG: selenocysteine-specific translation elongation factor, partial [Longimicrobiales bacterium]
MILGTAGHIDHGKTALVRALTGTDTDRLKEEKARGITIELGFAELVAEGRPHFGVVDVPGHEAFVRAMVAGAAGMDVVLLVVAADEGVMPQTREHLAIVELLAVPELVVAITKCDAVEEEWLELVDADIEDVLSSTRYAGAPRIRTSALARTGLEDLLDTLSDAAERVRADTAVDVTRLPLDRVFTIQGTGTVGTGTLWSGAIETGAKVRLLPDDLQARVRGLQVHGRDADRAEAGDRTAVALTG